VRVVIDANVAASAVCWEGEAFLCLVKLARRQAFAYGSETTLEETREVCARLIREKKPKHKATGRLTWYLNIARQVEAAPLGKGRSRDPKDDPYLATALAAKAQFIVTYDKDLLALGKPFGVEILKPSAFLRKVQG
jgi:putative PIN family toxin of toxin-antitoxin system